MAWRWLLLLGVGALASSVELWDDECEDDCALNALQRRARQLEENFVTEADTKETQSVSMEDLGNDELQRLVSAAQSELEKRGLGDGAELAVPGFEEMPDESSEEVAPEEVASDEDDAIGHQEGMSQGNESHDVAARAKRAASSMGSCNTNYYGSSPKELCFCKLAGNPGCASKSCTCPQGCGGSVVWKSGGSVTFKNRARASGCHPSTVLLTAPKAYYGTPADLKRCPNALSVIEMLLRDSWRLYQSRVSRGSMHQCFHGSRTASVKYLHLQSFCSYASFHAMPNNNHAVGVCVKMSSASQAGSLARQLYDQMQ